MAVAKKEPEVTTPPVQEPADQTPPAQEPAADETKPAAAAPAPASSSRRKQRFEEYEAVRPKDGQRVKVKRNIDTGDTTVTDVK